MSEWRKKQKSITRELGWGNSKEGNEKKHKQQVWHDYESTMKCPECGTTKQLDLIRLRDGYWECRNCGYANDIDKWAKRKD